MNTFPDVACDLWIIRAWLAGEALRGMDTAACNALLGDEIDDEEQGYGLPADYTCGPRLHVFSDDSCELWLGCLNADWVSPTSLCRLLDCMISDQNMMEAITLDGGPYVVALDGRQVTDWYRSEVHHGTAASD